LFGACKYLKLKNSDQIFENNLNLIMLLPPNINALESIMLKMWLFYRCNLCLIEIFSCFKNVIFLNESSKLIYRTWRGQEGKREHTDGQKTNYQKCKIFLLLIIIHLLYGVIIHVFGFINFKFWWVFWRNLVLCQVESQTETRSQFTPIIWVYYLLKVSKEIRIFWRKAKKLFSHRYKYTNVKYHSNCSIVQEFVPKHSVSQLPYTP